MFATFRKNDSELVKIEQLIQSGDLPLAASSLNALRERELNDPRIYSLGAQLGFAANNASAALQAADTALRLAPGWPRALLQRARALDALGRTKEALDACNLAASTDPKLLAAVELAVTLGRRLGDFTIPEALLRKAQAVAPSNVMIWLGLGRFLSRYKKDEAIVWLEKVLAHDANSLDALVTLASIYFELDRLDTASEVLARAEAIAPENDTVKFQAARIRGSSATQIPAAFVQNLFDEYADRFDAHLVGSLQYRLPLVVAEKIKARHPTAKFNLLDLGCGSGLLGRALGRIHGYFVGVDLSEKMLQKAVAVGTYDRLHHAEIVEALVATNADEYEVIAACDVLVYVADPEPLIRESHKVLRPRGTLYFSCEATAHGEPNVVLRASQRYAHSATWVRALCERHGYTDIALELMVVRTDNGKPIDGFLVTATKPG